VAEIQPTLNDDAVMDFVAKGYVVLESVVDNDFNRRCSDLKRGAAQDLIRSDDFIREVILHPEVAGVVRSLLGKDFLIPTGGFHHLFEEPYVGQEWHSDGISGRGYEVTEVQCYYYPLDVNLEDGPTIILPGSHCRAVNREAIAHYGDLVGQLPLIVKAGTVALTRYGIWHKAGPKLNRNRRSMIKFSYYRQSPPRRDWLIESEEVPVYRDGKSFPYSYGIEAYRDLRRQVRAWNWLCGLSDEESRPFDRWRSIQESGKRPVGEIAT
jgi:hypothetical protein